MTKRIAKAIPILPLINSLLFFKALNPHIFSITEITLLNCHIIVM
ncbi:hypothetical protein BVRB_6g132630 [Beta vulgaris subsp. vulgaris]|nr:hypothetical protein BVRB_6g132630 [Beta vulgaris subsp. vulgaris]